MPWNDKCLWGTPDDFNDAKARTAVENADFTNSVYVNISAKEGNTKQAYTYYVVDGYRICVVGHVHKDEDDNWTIAGNCFIPGWMGDDDQGWEMNTPLAQVGVIGPLNVGGEFPGNNRYPHEVE